jgi:hypothetical protein
MKELLCGITLVLALIGSQEASSLRASSDMTARKFIDSAGLSDQQLCITQENSPVAPLLLAKTKEEPKCLEQCSKTRYNCEKNNNSANRIGTKQNWEESTKCQGKYNSCLAQCEPS